MQRQREPAKTKKGVPLARVSRKRRAYLYVGLAALLVFPIAGRLYLWERDEKVAKPASVAVLPFVNVGADPKNEYFSDGITEDLTNALAKVEGLHVASRTSAFAFKRRQEDIQTIGDRLNVATVVKGSVRKEGLKLRITAQLINIADGYNLWSGTYERDLEDVFAIEDEISRTIVSKLEVKLVAEHEYPLVKRATKDLGAYDLYLRGRYYWNRPTKDGMRIAVKYFQRAIGKDPGYGSAYAGLADSYTVRVANSMLSPKEGYPRAEAAATRALELDENLGEAHTSMALVRMFYDWDWLAAEQEFNRAIELKPGYAAGHQAYAAYLTAMGRFDEAVSEMNRAQELDPLSFPIKLFEGWVYFNARQYDLAITQCRKMIELDPNFPGPYFILGQTYLAQSMFEEAVAAIRKGIVLSRDSREDAPVLGYAFAVSGRREEAHRILEQLKERSKREYVPAIQIAAVYIGLGDRDQAFEWMEKAYEERSGGMVFLKVDPAMDGLRSDPRFTALLKRMDLD